jgi:hypothetical protein
MQVDIPGFLPMAGKTLFCHVSLSSSCGLMYAQQDMQYFLTRISASTVSLSFLRLFPYPLINNEFASKNTAEQIIPELMNI